MQLEMHKSWKYLYSSVPSWSHAAFCYWLSVYFHECLYSK